jgi:uncharacterized protein (DUF1778 family)
MTMSGICAILTHIGGIMATQTNRTTKLDLRLSQDAKQTLSAAAQAAHCSVSQFVLKSALERAAETLAERQRFELNAEQWKEFMDALDAPPKIVPQIQRLFREPSPFDAPMAE